MGLTLDGTEGMSGLDVDRGRNRESPACLASLSQRSNLSMLHKALTPLRPCLVRRVERPGLGHFILTCFAFNSVSEAGSDARDLAVKDTVAGDSIYPPCAGNGHLWDPKSDILG